MKFSLNTTIIKPENNEKVKSAVILLHGYGGDGKDISMLTLNWKRFLKNTVFLCPDAHEVCSINPTGFQWFDLNNEDLEYTLQESKKAENVLKNYILEVSDYFNLEYSQICISGFSQGCMMSLYIGLTSEKRFSCIVGFSGRIINMKDLSTRIKTKTDILMIHGENDPIVPPNNLLEAEDHFHHVSLKYQF
jgi:phospholipase/carboxylesterase